jgi:hypothetical protein
MLLGALMTAGFLAAGTFSVPFEFEVSGKTMPAGSYEVARLSQTGSVFRLFHRDSGKSTMVNMPIQVTDAKADKPRMVFRCQGADCVMAEVWPSPCVGAARAGKRVPAKAVIVGTSN